MTIHHFLRAGTMVCLGSLLTLSGCQSTFGPSALENTHSGYNQAIVSSLDQQMLLNLIRLKYRDSPYFLEVGSVTASLEIAANLGVDSSLNVDNGVNILKPNIGVGYADRPTISYTPLRGEDFLKSVLAPIPLEAILVMTQSGWSIERVFGLTMERINNLHNAPRASGPTPEQEPEFRKFKRLLFLLRQLQLDGLIEIGPSLDPQSTDLVILLKSDNQHQPLVDEIRDLLGIVHKEQSNQFTISTNFLDTSESQWDVRVRSIAGVLFYLSQNIDVPPEHITQGLITVTKTADGNIFDWGTTPAGRVFKVRTAKQQPEKAFIATPYRGTWFYIQDNDLESKSTFMLLRQLFNLQAGQTKAAGPTLTLPVGR